MNNESPKKIDQLRTDSCSEKERKEILKMFHQEKMEFEIKQELYSQLNESPHVEANDIKHSEGFDRIWSKITANSSNKKNLTIRFAPLYWAAAILIIGLLIANLISHNSRINYEPTYLTAKAPKGSVSELILTDGTNVVLNAGSEIKYALDEKKSVREVFLKGEAWFNVEKNKSVPFIVHTFAYDVKVLGTEFNVKSYEEDNEVITTLEEGSIQIQSTPKLELAEQLTLKPGEQVVYNAESKEIQLKEVNAKIYSSWKNSELIFINMNLKDLVILLERKYGVDIEVVDESIYKRHYDGTIRNETIIQVLDILQATLPIKYEIVGQQIRIINK